MPDGLTLNPALVLDKKNFCSWRFGINPIPLAALNAPKVRIDDRCNFPAHEDPNTDSPTGIYEFAQRDSTQKVAAVPDGTELTLECVKTGEGTSDAVGDNSRIWIGVMTPDGQYGLIPDVNIGGGYTAQQLSGLGLGACP